MMTPETTNPTSAPCVAVLLCTYNGGRFLAEQLDSIAAQRYADWVVYASDDGSTDDTLQILERYRDLWGRARLVVERGPRQGFSQNFLSILRRANGRHRFYAFCDQDDRWHGDKLERALAWLNNQPAVVPSLYCGRTQVVDGDGHNTGLSPLFSKPPSFQNALMQNIAGGNTMVANASACQLLARTPVGMPLVCHDWWAYLLISGCGGRVHYDAHPTLDYRQHGANIIGAGITWQSRYSRLQRMFRGTFCEWNEINIRALEALADALTPDNVATLRYFALARQASLAGRLRWIATSKLYRQTLPGNLGLLLATVMNRI